jgi:pimeloyl-ACP methyl ester carboxylesterase
MHSEFSLASRGATIRYRRFGQGPALLFLRSEDSLPDAGAFIESLAQSFDVIIPDHPGFRNSDTPHWLKGIGMSCHVICADSTDRAVDLANQLEEHGKTNRIAVIAARALGPGLVGTPEVIADRIGRYEAAGVGTLMLHFHPMVEGIERFAHEVMPLLTRQAA